MTLNVRTIGVSRGVYMVLFEFIALCLTVRDVETEKVSRDKSPRGSGVHARHVAY